MAEQVQSGPQQSRARRFLGAGKRTLDGEDRSERIKTGRKGTPFRAFSPTIKPEFPKKLGLEQGGPNIFRRFRITRLETAEVPAALQHTWSGHAKSQVSEVYKKLLKQREWRLRWAKKTGTGFALPGHQQAAAKASNGKPGKLLEVRKVG